MAAMNLDLNKLKNLKLTKEQQQYLVVGVLGIAGTVYGYLTFVLAPLNKEIADLQAQVKTKQESLEKARRLKAQWEEYTQRLSRVQTGLQYVTRRLPPEATGSLPIEQLIKMCLEGGVQLTTFTPDTGTANKSEFGGFKKTSSSMTLVSDFHRLGNFLSRLSGEDVVYYVDDLALSVPPDNPLHNTVQATMKLVTYTDISTGGKP